VKSGKALDLVVSLTLAVKQKHVLELQSLRAKLAKLHANSADLALSQIEATCPDDLRAASAHASWLAWADRRATDYRLEEAQLISMIDQSLEGAQRATSRADAAADLHDQAARLTRTTRQKRRDDETDLLSSVSKSDDAL